MLAQFDEAAGDSTAAMLPDDFVELREVTARSSLLWHFVSVKATCYIEHLI